MTNDEELERFAEAVRETAWAAEPPHVEILYGDAVRRGKRIRRNRALATSAATVVALGAAGVLAATLSMSGAGPADGVSAASVTVSSGSCPVQTLSPFAVATPVTSGPETFDEVPLRTAAACGTVKQVLSAFLKELPEGTQVLPNEYVLDPPGQGLYANPDGGGVIASQYLVLGHSGRTGNSTVRLLAAGGAVAGDCAQLQALMGSTTDTCTTSPYDGGKLVFDKTKVPAGEGRTEPLWQDFWVSPAGYEVGLSIEDSSQADFALTQSQILAMLTDPAWRTITGELSASAAAAN